MGRVALQTASRVVYLVERFIPLHYMDSGLGLVGYGTQQTC